LASDSDPSEELAADVLEDEIDAAVVGEAHHLGDDSCVA